MRGKGVLAPCIAALLALPACEGPKAEPGGEARSLASPPAPDATSRPALADPPVPTASVPHLGNTPRPVLDGDLGDPAWARAARIGPFVNVSTGGPARGLLQGRARMAWDDAFLFVALEVSDAKIRGGFPEDAVDPHLWERDTVELMIDPDGDGDNRDYYEIQVGPQNLVFDSRFDAYNRPAEPAKGRFGHMDWRSKIESAVKLDGTLDDDSDEDRGYVVEARIPWSSFDRAKKAPPAPGDAWRVNLYAMQDNGGVAWSPILGRGNFHKASRFGRVVFTR